MKFKLNLAPQNLYKIWRVVKRTTKAYIYIFWY